MAKTVLGIFIERSDAEQAINELKTNGYNPKDISIVMKDKGEGEKLAEDTGADVVGGALSGATTGALLGGLAGLLASFVIPGLGAFFIGGPIATALGLTGAAASTASGAATGALAGGLLGALTGFGLSEDEARTYEEQVNTGGILVAVPARSGEENEVEQILSQSNANQIRSVSAPQDRTRQQKNSTTSHQAQGRNRSDYAFAQAKGGKASRSSNSKE